MEGFETIIFEKTDGIGILTLNRPEALNAFNVQMREDLHLILGAVRDDDEIKVVILKGAGEKAFCAGADLSEFLTSPPPTAARTVRFERDVWGRLLRIRQPMIAALQGYVLGSGIEMALCCDIRICSENARFGLPEVQLGMIPAAGGTQTLPRVVGIPNAIDMLLTDDWISSWEARRIGLVTRVVPTEDLYETARSMAAKIASFDSTAVTQCKQAIIRGQDLTLTEGLALEERLSRLVRANSDKKRENTVLE